MTEANNTSDAVPGSGQGVCLNVALPESSQVSLGPPQQPELEQPVTGPPRPRKPSPPKLPNVLFLCMHKAASTFVADVLLPSIAIRTSHYDLFNVGSMMIKFFHEKKELYGLKPPGFDYEHDEQLRLCLNEWKLPRSNALIGRIYPGHMKVVAEMMGNSLPGKGQRLCVVRRDPRDALISLFYSVSISHNPDQIEGNPDDYRRYREDLRNKELCDGLKTLLRTEELGFTLDEFEYCTDLIRSNKRVCDLPYELLMNDPEQWLNRFVRYGKLQRYVDDAWTREMLEHLQPPAVEDPGSHKRRMRPGNWVEVFDDELKGMMDQRLGKRMAEFGYHW